MGDSPRRGDHGWSILLAGVLLIGLLSFASGPAAAQEGDDPFTFAVTSDMRFFAGPGYDSSSYFKGVVEAIDRLGGGAFMVSPGDVDPPASVLWTITRTLGVTYTWYPVVGNHELPGYGVEDQPGDNMDWLNGYDYGPVSPGPTGCPTTTYSFDYGNAHFVVLNEYCDSAGDDVTDGDVPDHLYDWLRDDLDTTDRGHVFVFGHEPAYPQPDADNGRARHMGVSLNAYPAHRDRFWNLLKDEGVVAYFCGHTHNYSAVNVDGVWQVDAGHARGAGDLDAPSTFVTVHVDGTTVTFDSYRDGHDGTYDYDDITRHGTLAPLAHRSFQDGVSPTASYAGTRDTYIDVDNPDTNYGGGSETTLVSDGDPDQAAILQWDISSIPPGSTIQAASIVLSVTNPSSDTYELHEMKRAWVETEATWNRYSAGNLWQQSGAQGASDRGEDVLGAITASSTGLYVVNLNDGGVGLVQRWVDDPSTNHGLIIADYGAGDAVRFDARDVSTASRRPKLTIVFSASPNSAQIAGATTGLVSTGYALTVTVGPVTASLPISYLWQAADQAPVAHTGSVSLEDTQVFTWAVGGRKAITVTVANAGGTMTATHAIAIYTPVQAAFTASPTSGVAPLTVAFTNASSGDYTGSLWGFGDGVTSTLHNPTHTYLVAAVYTATLHVGGPGGSDTETKAAYITVHEPHSVYLPLVVRGCCGDSSLLNVGHRDPALLGALGHPLLPVGR